MFHNRIVKQVILLFYTFYFLNYLRRVEKKCLYTLSYLHLIIYTKPHTCKSCIYAWLSLSLYIQSTAVYPTVHGATGCSQKSFKLVWRCHQLLSGFLLAKRHVPRVSRQSRHDMGDNEMIPGAVHRSPDICLIYIYIYTHICVCVCLEECNCDFILSHI